MDDKKETGNELRELTPPPWLDVAFIQEALRSGEEENLKVTGLTVRAATAPGDNYSSTIYRVKAALSNGGEKWFLVKEPPPGAEMAQSTATLGAFKRESLMLAEVVPQIEALLEVAAPGHYSPLAARCPHYGDNPVEFLVVEDLAPQGFKMADRRRGLGLRHCLIALRALGRFHGASAALLQKDPSLGERIGWPYQLSKGQFDSFIVAGFDLTIGVCREWPGFEDIVRRLNSFKEIAMQTYIDMHDPLPGRFNVITHGDLWTNNIMFRYEDGQPQDVRFVDLQISHVTSPATDLHYFLASSPSESVSARYEDLLIREYHSALAETMVLLGLQPPPLEELLTDLNSHGTFALFGPTRLLPIMKSRDVPDIDATIAGDDKSGAYMYREPDVQKWLKRVLPEYSRKGWLPE